MKWRKWIWKITKWCFATLLFLVLTTSALIYFYKDTIINYAVGEINKYLNAEAKVKKIDITFWSTFPNVSMDFNNVLIQDAYPTKKSSDTLIYANLIRLKFNPIDLWNEKYDVKKVMIRKGVVKLRIANNGEDNYHILKDQKSSESSKFKLSLRAIESEQIRFLYDNKLSEGKYSATFNKLLLSGDFSQDKFKLDAESDFLVHKIQQGLVHFVHNKSASASVSVMVNNVANTISIKNGKLLFSQIPLDFNLLIGKDNLQLDIQGKSISLEALANNIAAKEVETMHQLNGAGSATFNLNLETQLNKDSYPKIQCEFTIKNGKIREPIKNLALSNINVKGIISTEKGKGNEVLDLENISFSTISGPFQGALRIHNFSLPSYLGHAQGTVDLEVIQSIFRLPKIEKLTGKVSVDTRFNLKTIQAEGVSSIEIVDGDGSAQLSNVTLQLQQDSRKFRDISGNLILNRSNAILEDLQVKLGESDLKLNGNFDNIDLFLQDKNNLNITVIAESDNINLSDFNNASITEETTNTQSLKEWILPAKIIGSAKISVKTIQLNQHIFNQISGNMTLGSRSILIEKLHGISANATVDGTLGIVETSPEYFQMATNLSSKDLYFKPIFREWNNFDQKMISESNIGGRAEAILDLKAPFDLRYGILKEEIEAQIQLKIISGQLKDVSAFKALSKDLKNSKAKLVLGKKDIEALENKLSNIAFDTLQNTIFIQKGTVIIPKMDIKSNVLNISLEAKHQFNNNIDYQFSFRFRELKSVKDESEFGIVTDDGTGFLIYARMFGNIDHPTIVWDKSTRKEEFKQNREDAKKETMSILKTEFGLFKKDSTVNKYQPKKQEHEVLQIEFGKEEKVNPYEEKKKLETEKKGLKKLGETFKKQQEEQEEEFSIE